MVESTGVVGGHLCHVAPAEPHCPSHPDNVGDMPFGGYCRKVFVVGTKGKTCGVELVCFDAAEQLPGITGSTAFTNIDMDSVLIAFQQGFAVATFVIVLDSGRHIGFEQFIRHAGGVAVDGLMPGAEKGYFVHDFGPLFGNVVIAHHFTQSDNIRAVSELLHLCSQELTCPVCIQRGSRDT